MYNRYVRNDSGVYTRMPQSDAPLPAGLTFLYAAVLTNCLNNLKLN